MVLNSLYRSVTATFHTLPNARILGSSELYGLIQQAYDDASSGAVIQARGVTFVEELALDDDKELTIKGGYDQEFSLQNGETKVMGSVTVVRGGVTLERLTIM